MPIRRSGYVGDTHRKERAKLYNSKSWRHVRALVKARAGGRCEWCRKQGVDAVHLTGTTLDAIRSGDALNVNEIALGCRSCHARFAAGLIGRPW